MNESTMDFIKNIKPGDIIRVETGTVQRNIDGVYHVLGIFDDEWIAVKSFFRPKNKWIYEFINSYFLGKLKEAGWIK